jgi:hypothetical protein
MPTSTITLNSGATGSSGRPTGWATWAPTTPPSPSANQQTTASRRSDGGRLSRPPSLQFVDSLSTDRRRWCRRTYRGRDRDASRTCPTR